MDRQTNRKADGQSDFIRRCPTNIERPKISGLLSLPSLNMSLTTGLFSNHRNPKTTFWQLHN